MPCQQPVWHRHALAADSTADRVRPSKEPLTRHQIESFNARIAGVREGKQRSRTNTRASARPFPPTLHARARHLRQAKSPPDQKQRGKMNRQSIRDRLSNWFAWSRGGHRRGMECMTGVVCDSLRRAALGDVWPGSGNVQQLDAADAALVERAWKTLAPTQKELLRWHHIRNAAPGMICRRLGIAARPASIFAIELARAEEALGKVLSDQVITSLGRA
jgi:hypothetical protein